MVMVAGAEGVVPSDTLRVNVSVSMPARSVVGEVS